MTLSDTLNYNIYMDNYITTLGAQILANIIEKERIPITLGIHENTLKELLGNECLRVISDIQKIVSDKSLSDFEALEQIICLSSQ